MFSFSATPRHLRPANNELMLGGSAGKGEGGRTREGPEEAENGDDGTCTGGLGYLQPCPLASGTAPSLIPRR